MTAADARVVRVLNGSRTGSEAALPANGRASIGHEYWHDVVLRDASTEGCAVEIEVGEGGVGRLTVLDGTAVLLGSTLRGGDTATLPPYVPVALGDIAFAHGTAGSERWTEASSLATTSQAETTVADGTPGPVESLAEGWRASLRDSSGSRLGRAISPRALLVVAAMLLLLVGIGPAIDALQLGGSPAERLQSAISAAGYASVTVKGGADDTVAVGGYVPTDNDRQRVQSIIDAKALRAVVSIETGDEQARSAADVTRMAGIEARARPLRAGVVELTTTPLDQPGRQRVEAAVRRDVPGLRRLVFQEDASMGAPDEVKTIADATKRVASVVAGDPAYIVTVDGARYFPGAVMPSGHRLVAIQEQTVVLERNGRQTVIKF